jgi:hypothetical protein
VPDAHERSAFAEPAEAADLGDDDFDVPSFLK